MAIERGIGSGRTRVGVDGWRPQLTEWISIGMQSLVLINLDAIVVVFAPRQTAAVELGEDVDCLHIVFGLVDETDVARLLLALVCTSPSAFKTYKWASFISGASPSSSVHSFVRCPEYKKSYLSAKSSH